MRTIYSNQQTNTAQKLMRLAFCTSAVTIIFLVNALQTIANACPFCQAAAQTLRQEMTSMDVVAIAKLAPTKEETIDGQATFVISKIVQGEKFAQAGDTLVAPYFGPGKNEKQFLVMAVGPQDLLWSSPLTLSATSTDYIEKLFKLSDDIPSRLRFFFSYLENPEPLLSGDAYDEFALAPYSDVVAIKPTIDRDKVWHWLDDASVSPERKRLYYTLLGIVAQDGDAKRLQEKLRSQEPNEKAGLDALIACYLTIEGEKALPLIDELFLTNAKAIYGDTYSAIMALRFQGTEGDKIPRPALLKSMRHLLDRPEYADLVIPDLARWEDWSQIDKLVELFEKADEGNSWVRVPVINYLRACPLPEAKAQLEHLATIDPKAVQRASTYYPMPLPKSPSENEGSGNDSPRVLSDTRNMFAFAQSSRVEDLRTVYSSAESVSTESKMVAAAVLKPVVSSFACTNSIQAGLRTDTGRPSSLNRGMLWAVTLLMSINFASVMMFVMTGSTPRRSRWNDLRSALYKCFS